MVVDDESDLEYDYTVMGDIDKVTGIKYQVSSFKFQVSVVTRLEIHRLKQSISNIDPDAFLFVQSIKEVKGGVIKQSSIKA